MVCLRQLNFECLCNMDVEGGLRMWTGFIWLTTGSSGGQLHEVRGISWLTERLLAYQGLFNVVILESDVYACLMRL
jgi:hypothetical protein